MIPKLVKLWSNVMTILFNIALLLTFLGFIPTVIHLYYNLFVMYSVDKVIISCIVLLVLIHSNKAIQGGKL